MALRYLTAEVECLPDGSMVLEAAASTLEAEHAAVLAEVDALRAWCTSQVGESSGPRDDGACWDESLSVQVESGGWYAVRLTIAADGALMAQLMHRFFPDDA